MSSTGGAGGNHYLHVTDNRNGIILLIIKGNKYEIRIKNNRESNHIMAKDIQKIKDKGTVLRIYDPAFMNTISAVFLK